VTGYGTAISRIRTRGEAHGITRRPSPPWNSRQSSRAGGSQPIVTIAAAMATQRTRPGRTVTSVN